MSELSLATAIRGQVSHDLEPSSGTRRDGVAKGVHAGGKRPSEKGSEGQTNTKAF